MFHINRFFITLAILSLLVLMVSSVSAQDSAFLDTPIESSIRLHIIPENAPVEIWRTQGSQLVEGWLSVSTLQQRTASTVTIATPTHLAGPAIHVVPFATDVSIWRMDGGRIVEGWVSDLSQ